VRRIEQSARVKLEPQQKLHAACAASAEIAIAADPTILLQTW
jgi:hypothetical protein